jgi:hypothetical protein
VEFSPCDNPVVGKHLDGNTRLLAEILWLSTICIPIYIYISLFQYKIVINQCSSIEHYLYLVVPLVLVSVLQRRAVRDS